MELVFLVSLALFPSDFSDLPIRNAQAFPACSGPTPFTLLSLALISCQPAACRVLRGKNWQLEKDSAPHPNPCPLDQFRLSFSLLQKQKFGFSGVFDSPRGPLNPTQGPLSCKPWLHTGGSGVPALSPDPGCQGWTLGGQQQGHEPPTSWEDPLWEEPAHLKSPEKETGHLGMPRDPVGGACSGHAHDLERAQQCHCTVLFSGCLCVSRESGGLGFIDCRKQEEARGTWPQSEVIVRVPWSPCEWGKPSRSPGKGGG